MLFNEEMQEVSYPALEYFEYHKFAIILIVNAFPNFTEKLT